MALKIALYHGDMVVMHGPDIHRHYEHAVDPFGKRRYALTCRYIVPEKLPDDRTREEAAQKGAIPDWARTFRYDGY